MNPIIYHNPSCGTSRNTLAMMRASGETPDVVEYLKTPPSHEQLRDLIQRMGSTPRALLRRKEAVYGTLGLDDPGLTDAQLIDAMLAHPILIERPIVVTDKGVRLCRPAEQVLDLLAQPVASFTKENGETVQHAAAR